MPHCYKPVVRWINLCKLILLLIFFTNHRRTPLLDAKRNWQRNYSSVYASILRLNMTPLFVRIWLHYSSAVDSICLRGDKWKPPCDMRHKPAFNDRILDLITISEERYIHRIHHASYSSTKDGVINLTPWHTEGVGGWVVGGLRLFSFSSLKGSELP